MAIREILIFLSLFSPLGGGHYTFAASITDPNGKVIQLNSRPLPYRYDKCAFCHIKKSREFISRKTHPTRQHAEKEAVHGHFIMECQSCHDINNSNYLLSGISVVANFENPSGVCNRCHADKYRDWRRGIHGKRIGYWNGDKTQFHCIDCHNAHSVKFKEMEASPAPYTPKFLINKDEEKE